MSNPVNGPLAATLRAEKILSKFLSELVTRKCKMSYDKAVELLVEIHQKEMAGIDATPVQQLEGVRYVLVKWRETIDQITSQALLQIAVQTGRDEPKKDRTHEDDHAL